MSFIHDGKVMLCHPRTGSSAIRAALGITFPRQRHMPYRDLCIQGDEPVGITVRNPYDTLVSWWLLNPKWSSFATFIKEYNHSRFARGGLLFWLEGPVGSRLIRYESLEADLSAFFEREVKLPIVNRTKGKDRHYMEYYGVAALVEMRKRFGKEIERLGYQIR